MKRTRDKTRLDMGQDLKVKALTVSLQQDSKIGYINKSVYLYNNLFLFVISGI